MSHALIGLLLIVVVFGAVFFLYETHFFDSFNPLVSSLGSVYGTSGSSGTSTVNQSPYYHEVRIQFVSLSPMVVSVGATLSKDSGLDVTGWALWVNKTAYVIPQVVNLYSPSVPGVAPEDIYIKPAGLINFYAGTNPNGKDEAIRSGLTEWQVWFGSSFNLPLHGTITLDDQSGKQVDQYPY
jgi:hypothetical protein